MPAFAFEKRLSRIETLRLAIGYISFMSELLLQLGAGPDYLKQVSAGPDYIKQVSAGPDYIKQVSTGPDYIKQMAGVVGCTTWTLWQQHWLPITGSWWV